MYAIFGIRGNTAPTAARPTSLSRSWSPSAGSRCGATRSEGRNLSAGPKSGPAAARRPGPVFNENRTLQAKYELVFDLEAIEQQFLSDGTMVKPSSGQTVYLDLSGGDSVVYYDGAGDGLSGILQRAEQFFAALMS